MKNLLGSALACAAAMILAGCTANTAEDSGDEIGGRRGGDATSGDVNSGRGVPDAGIPPTTDTGGGTGALDVGLGTDTGGTADGSGGQTDSGAGVCGDGVLDVGEECDDGNTAGGDGCEADCTLPAGGRGVCEPCTSSSQCGTDADFCIDIGGSAACASSCAGSLSCLAGYECRFALAVEGSDGGPQCVPESGYCGDCDDADNDTVCDDVDACPGEDDRIDGDGDGLPDACDGCPSDNPNDSDGDGVCDSDDICEGGDDGADRDSDGVPNFCDPCPDDEGTTGCDPPPAELCGNGVDDDGDDATDCDDPDCSSDPACSGGGGAGTCAEPFQATLGLNVASLVANEQHPSCQSNDGAEAVFAFTPTLGQFYCVDTTGSAVTDTVLSVRANCADAGSEAVCVDDAASARPGGSVLSAWATLEATTAREVYILVDGYRVEEGEISLTITEGACEGGAVDPGDLPFDGEGFESCADPFLITAYGDYAGPAVTDDDIGSCSSPFGGGAEAVIAFLAPETGTVCASTVGSATSDTVVYVRTSCDPSSELACSDDEVSLWGQVEFAATAGEVYFVFLEEYSSGFSAPSFSYSITAGPCL